MSADTPWRIRLTPSGPLEQKVTAGMPQMIVDPFQAIDIYHDDADRELPAVLQPVEFVLLSATMSVQRRKAFTPRLLTCRSVVFRRVLI